MYYYIYGKTCSDCISQEICCSGISVSAEASLLSRLTELAETMAKDLETLKADTAMAEYEVDKDLLKSAKLYQSVVLTDMEKVRVSADAAEASHS